MELVQNEFPLVERASSSAGSFYQRSVAPADNSATPPAARLLTPRGGSGLTPSMMASRIATPGTPTTPLSKGMSSCDICYKSFTRKADMNRHKKTVHENRPTPARAVPETPAPLTFGMLRTLRADGVYNPEKVLHRLAINPDHLGAGKDKIRMKIKRALATLKKEARNNDGEEHKRLDHDLVCTFYGIMGSEKTRKVVPRKLDTELTDSGKRKKDKRFCETIKDLIDTYCQQNNRKIETVYADTIDMLTGGRVPAVTDSIRRGDATISPPQTLASVFSVIAYQRAVSCSTRRIDILRKFALQNWNLKIPSAHDLRELRLSRCSDILECRPIRLLDRSFQNVGVYTPLSESVKRSMIELYEIGLIFPGCRKIMIDLKYGADGAGSHHKIRNKEVRLLEEVGHKCDSLENMGYGVLGIYDKER